MRAGARGRLRGTLGAPTRHVRDGNAAVCPCGRVARAWLSGAALARIHCAIRRRVDTRVSLPATSASRHGEGSKRREQGAGRPRVYTVNSAAAPSTHRWRSTSARWKRWARSHCRQSASRSTNAARNGCVRPAITSTRTSASRSLSCSSRTSRACTPRTSRARLAVIRGRRCQVSCGGSAVGARDRSLSARRRVGRAYRFGSGLRRSQPLHARVQARHRNNPPGVSRVVQSTASEAGSSTSSFTLAE